jgi:3-hydroxy-9,10-secoandrosta-1,3,5(10)-triene-9,17-dione monooxygenase reductase component
MSTIKDAMSCFTTGVTVVTTHFEMQDWAMTCNSFNTVSMDPALVLWSVGKSAFSHRAFTQSSGFLVNILSLEQKDLALKFSTGSQADRFKDEPIERLKSQRTKLPLSLAWFDCEIEQRVSAGDHDILIGRVLEFGSSSGTGLALSKRQFGYIEPIAQ